MNSISDTASSVKQLDAGEAVLFTDKLRSRWPMLVALLLLVNSLSSASVFRVRESITSDICSALWEDWAEDVNSESQYELKHFSSNDLSCSQGFFICHMINYTGYNQKWNVGM